MAVYLYDEAITNKIKAWTANTNVHVFSPDDTHRLFEVIADDTNDKPIELPIIAIRRNTSYELSAPHRKPMSYDGGTMDATYDKSIQLNAIPITLGYQIDIYTRYLKEADEYVRNLVFNIINFPSISITLPYYNQEVVCKSSISLSPTITDNSNVSERLVAGMFSRFTLNITIPECYLWDVRVRENYHVEADINEDN